MTLRQPNIERMLQLGLTGMGRGAGGAKRSRRTSSSSASDDRLAMMIEREAEHRGPQELPRPISPCA